MKIDLSNLNTCMEAWRIVPERSIVKKARSKDYIYLLRGTKKPYSDISKIGLTVEKDGLKEARVSDKEIWFTTSERYASIYGNVYLVKLNTKHVSFIENMLYLFDEYTYNADVPPEDIYPIESNEAKELLATLGYLRLKSTTVKVKVAKSKIHGKGVICTSSISEGEIISLAFRKVDNTGKSDNDWELSDIAHAINHSDKPNAKLVSNKTKVRYIFVAIKNIKKGEELVVDYNEAPDFVDKPKGNWK